MRRIFLALALVALLPVAGQPAAAIVDRSAGWIVGCRFSHRSMDDPIVMPGMADMSHSHDFFGNETTDANSTLASLQTGPAGNDLGSILGRS